MLLLPQGRPAPCRVENSSVHREQEAQDSVLDTLPPTPAPSTVSTHNSHRAEAGPGGHQEDRVPVSSDSTREGRQSSQAGGVLTCQAGMWH